MSDIALEPIGSVFESFNARSLAAEQVAKTFVPPASFKILALRSHSTVIGPRGSGKTSLLKMLQPRALENWKAPEAATYRSHIDYTGVFIPTDITWNRQTLAIVESLPQNLVQLVRGAAFTTHVLHELIGVLLWRTEEPTHGSPNRFRRVTLSREQERAMVRQLAASWMLEPATETLIGLKHSLTGRQVAIWTWAQRISLLAPEGSAVPVWLSLDFLSCCGQAVELFDDAVNEGDARWALLFDELELAPEWIMHGLITALRSTNEKFLFKLAVSPFNERYESLRTAIDAMPDQDYKEILLWHAYKEEGFEFSRRLVLNICNDGGLEIEDITDLVGDSFLDIDSDVKPYQPGSTQYRVLARALRTDSTFARYWEYHKLRLEDLADMSESDRASKVRKIYPLVLIRNFFRAPSGSRLAHQQRRRSRKSMEIYSGATAILTLSEGNPRWIIGLTRLLVQSAQSVRMPVRRSEQAKFVEETIHKFRARLKTIPAGEYQVRGKRKTLLDLLDQIGNYFRARVILDEFHTQPSMSFTVDSQTSPELLVAIGRAVNAGALVYVPEKGSLGLLNDVRGKRFRLSYLLAPLYSLPLRLGASVSLSAIVVDSGRSSDSEPSLF